MAYEPKANSGTFWPNDRKTAANQPDWKGDIHIDPALLKDLIGKSDGLVKIAVAGWNKDLGGKKAISLSASAPYIKPSEDEIPY